MKKSSLGIDPAINLLLEKASGPEMDYGFVMDTLRIYKNPRVKLNHLLKIKALIRVKKGLYIFGDKFSRHPYSPEILANLIYGPSYLSLEWACAYYNLIPEKVITITSVTTKRKKQFQTPIGLFTYDHLPISAYSVGINLVQSALFATKEKALCDLLVIRRGSLSSKKQLREILFEDFRIENVDLKQMDKNLIAEIYKAHPHSAIKFLMEFLYE